METQDLEARRAIVAAQGELRSIQVRLEKLEVLAGIREADLPRPTEHSPIVIGASEPNGADKAAK